MVSKPLNLVNDGQQESRQQTFLDPRNGPNEFLLAQNICRCFGVGEILSVYNTFSGCLVLLLREEIKRSVGLPENSSPIPCGKFPVQDSSHQKAIMPKVT